MGSGRELRQHDVSDFLRFCTELAFPGKNFAPGCPRNGKCQLARPIASPAFRPSAAFARNSRAPTGRDSSKLFAGFTHMPFCIVEFVGKHCTSSNTTFLTSADLLLRNYHHAHTSILPDVSITNHSTTMCSGTPIHSCAHPSSATPLTTLRQHSCSFLQHRRRS